MSHLANSDHDSEFEKNESARHGTIIVSLGSLRCDVTIWISQHDEIILPHLSISTMIYHLTNMHSPMNGIDMISSQDRMNVINVLNQ
jgi:hypothetical protein